MKLRLFFGGLLVGSAIGLMVGGALVKISPDEPGKRIYPQGLALLLAVVGGVGAGSTLRGSGSA
jgi:NhaP-type Na+/H+ or K+/H+ antiporter